MEDLSYLKKADTYHFSFPFEYIKKKHGDNDYDIANAIMDVDVEWSDANQGYVIYYSSKQENLIDPAEGNSDLEEFFEYSVEDRVRAELASYGIHAEAICCSSYKR